MTPPSFADPLDVQDEPWRRNRRRLLRLLVAFTLVAPFLSAHRPDAARVWLLLPTTVIFIVMADRIVLRSGDWTMSLRVTWTWLTVMIGIAVVILAVGGPNWVSALVIAGAAIGRVSPTPRTAAVCTACCGIAGLGVGLARGITYGNSLDLVLLPAMASFFGYAATRRNELVSRLRATRAELARMAVADERLRIARDLHDLLGHSLSLITLKAELAGRTIGTDPDRAAREIADLETVARRSLGEVRAAVTSYRQPSLAAELAAARQMLATAGMECRVHAPGSLGLDPATEALLAWTVREGATNVVRHSGACLATITISVADDEVAAEVADDGVGPAWDCGPNPGEHRSGAHNPGQHRPGQLGSGLAGLAERARGAGAEISAGAGHEGKGFRLRVRVPAGQFSVS
jgi:two-component system sensor histidine kinase DesK